MASASEAIFCMVKTPERDKTTPGKGFEGKGKDAPEKTKDDEDFPTPQETSETEQINHINHQEHLPEEEETETGIYNEYLPTQPETPEEPHSQENTQGNDEEKENQRRGGD